MKTTNPSLIKRFYKGTLEVGDYSKDFIIEPDYALVFNGKVKYRKDPVKCIVAWRDSAGEFNSYQFYESHPVTPLMRGMWSVGREVQKDFPDYESVTKMMFGIIAKRCVSDIKQSEFEILIENFNYTYSQVKEKEKFWEEINAEKGPPVLVLRFLWNGSSNKDISNINEDFAAFIMERRMDNG